MSAAMQPMNGAKRALAQVMAFRDLVRKGPALPKAGKRSTEEMLRKLGVMADQAVQRRAPSRDRVAEALASIRLAVAERRAILALGDRTLLDGAWAMWMPGEAGASIPGFLSAAFVVADGNARMLRRLADVWLRDFDVSEPAIPAGNRIGQLLLRSDATLVRHWRQAQAAYDLFDGMKGPDTVARRIVDGAGEDTLRACRLDDEARAHSGYMRAVALAVARQAARPASGSDTASCDRALSFLAPGPFLRFPEADMRGRVADALVSPWLSGRVPSEALRTRILTFLRQKLSDPRVKPERWDTTSADTKRIVFGWLSTLTLDAFFRTIGRFAMDSGYEHHWRQREAFWRACLQKQFIQGSWLVVGDNVRSELAAKPDLLGIFGTIAGGGNDRNHSVLLMEIGRHVFAEWSHNGRLRVWESGDKRAPLLYNTGEFSAALLKGQCLPFPPPRGRYDLSETSIDGLTHHAGTWRQRVAEFLRINEGLILEEREWQLR